MQDWDIENTTAISLLILDPEDILYDGRPIRVQALARALDDQALSKNHSPHVDRWEADYGQLAQQIELNVDASLAILRQEDSLRHVLDRVEEIRMELMGNQKLLPFNEFLDVLRKLKEYGCEIAIYSNGLRDTMLILMERLGLDPLIGFCTCTQDTGRLIPAGAIPDILENMQFLPSETVLVSNNPILLNQAREMEIQTVVCRWGNPTPEVLSLADHTIDAAQQLYRFMEQTVAPAIH